ncbi:MAG: glycosyl hydrolase [Chitinophagaceae bacterium]
MHIRIWMLLPSLLWVSHSMHAQELSDRSASRETQVLYQKLKKVVDRNQYLIGHQDDLAYGVYWKYQNGRSDVKDVIGDYPALYGWELADLELGHSVNIDGVPFDRMRSYIEEGCGRGGAITIGWHINNPLTGKTAWDTTSGTVKSILPGGKKHRLFLRYLDSVANFIGSLKDPKGNLIPVLFRPFHELTGNWFWWGRQGCTPVELQSLFRYTVNYLRIVKQLHNLIIVYNTADNFMDEADYMRGYPSDEYVDILSFDTYQYGDSTHSIAFANNLEKKLALLKQIGEKHHKLIAIGEMGFNTIPDSRWFTSTIAPVLAKFPIAYTLFWRNAGYKPKEKEMEYYIPYQGHSSANDFKLYIDNGNVLTEKQFRNVVHP